MHTSLPDNLALIAWFVHKLHFLNPGSHGPLVYQLHQIMTALSESSTKQDKNNTALHGE